MRTVKEVSNLTGISVRMLHYYDKIGLLKPSKITDAGYRLYDDEALKTLQQILFFKELEMPLKVVKDIMTSDQFDKRQALENQSKLLILKRNRLNDLIELINRTLKGDAAMSFKEFDMSEYYNVLEEFKAKHEDKVIKMYGSVDKFNEFIEKFKANEAKIAKSAIKQYGSVEKYARAVSKNLNSDTLTTMGERYDEFKKDCLEDKHPKLKELYKELVADLSKDPYSKEIQEIAEEITNTAKKDYEIFRMDNGDYCWESMVQIYRVYPEWIEKVDRKYGKGASKFIGEALNNYLKDKQPKINILYEKLTSDLSRDPSSKEIQQIVEEIAELTNKIHESLNIDAGDNYWGYMADNYLSNPTYMKVMDNKYGSGASKFIGEALRFYAENKMN